MIFITKPTILFINKNRVTENNNGVGISDDSPIVVRKP